VLIHKFIKYVGICGLFISLFFISACSSSYDYDDFTFIVPAGYKTKEFESYTDKKYESEYFIFTKKGNLYFQIFRKEIPLDSNLDQLFEAYFSKSKPAGIHYQFISRDRIQVNNRPAIEYVYREFNGEPYIQSREIWMENNNQAYMLICSQAVDATPGAIIPVSEDCINLLEGFHFK
jgi:hypothetical protein